MSALSGRSRWTSGIGSVGWAVAAVALLFQNPYGELGGEPDRFLLLQILALSALASSAIGFALRRGGGSGLDAGATVSPTLHGPLASSLVRWALAVGVAGVVAMLASVDRMRSLLGAPPRLFGLASELALLVLFLVLAPRCSTVESRERLETALLATAGALVAYALVQWAGLDPLRWQVDWQGRPVAAQGNPLFLAQALVWLVPIAVGRTVARFRAGERRAAAAAAALALAAGAIVLRTGERAPLLGLAVAGVVFAAVAGLSSPRARAQRAGWALAGVLGASLVAGSWVALERADLFTGTASQRLLLWKSVVRLFAASPASRLLVGFGQESLPIVLPPFLPPELPERIWRPDLYHDRAHNALLDALAAGGGLRLVCVLGLAWAAGRAALRLAGVRRARGPVATSGLSTVDERWRGVGLAAALSGHAVAAQFGVATAATAALFWLTLALLAGSQLLPESGLRRTAPSGRRAAEALESAARRESLAVGIFAGALLALVAFGAWVPAQRAGDATAGRVFLLLVVAAGGIGLALASRPALAQRARWREVRGTLAWFGGAAVLQALLLSATVAQEWNLALALVGLAAAIAVTASLRSSPGRDAGPGAKGSVRESAPAATVALADW